jgi:polyisoprenoid-binding protein YceI
MRRIRIWSFVVLVLAFASTLAECQEREVTLHFDPMQSKIEFMLGDVLHTVRGTFRLQSGDIHFARANNMISGEIVIDATSGNSGSAGRDSKMHREILESPRYREITFVPDRVEGKVMSAGSSTVQVHGMFGIHGSEHEIVLPVQVELASDHWALKTHFAVPYVKWGMKDPSTFILRVEKIVEIDLNASGPSPSHTRP